jgi:hypothetical protein
MQYLLIVPLLLKHLATQHSERTHLLEKLYHHIAENLEITPNRYYYMDTTDGKDNQIERIRYCVSNGQNFMVDQAQFKEAILMKERIAFLYAVTAISSNGKHFDLESPDNIEMMNAFKKQFLEKVSKACPLKRQCSIALP